MFTFILFAVFIATLQLNRFAVQADTNKYRVCVVDGRGGFKKSGVFCPILDKPDSKVECVIGQDRLDCLRRIAKGKVDFAVFTAEDLISATNSQIEVLITNELRFIRQRSEYDVVAVVSDDSGIGSKHDLRDKRLCHPGYGYKDDWTRILANYFEASVVLPSCETSISLTENRIKASSEFFRAACKAGPWVNNPLLDAKLKRKYSNLCALCANSKRCSTSDKYWGRRGPLYCLTDGVGDVTWARLDDTLAHFGMTPGAEAASPAGFSYLCPDGTSRPINSTLSPCVWVSKPWPVVGAKRSSALEIQRFINRLNHSDEESWQHALLNLLEMYHVDITTVSPVQAIESYLAATTGFQSANSFSGCHPPRTIRVCVNSNAESAKCGWMREAAAAYGLEPDFDCVQAQTSNKTDCLRAVQSGVADVVLVPSDLLVSAVKDFALKTLLYEDARIEGRYRTVPVVPLHSTLTKWTDLKGKRACFPASGGVAWYSVLHHLQDKCPTAAQMARYFGDSCAPGSTTESFRKLCPDAQKSSSYQGDLGAIRCLIGENADVAFISKSAIPSNLRLLSNRDNETELSWAALGQLMVRNSTADITFEEIFDAFTNLDELFGNNYKSVTRSFSLYGSFNGNHDVLFHDQTTQLTNQLLARDFLFRPQRPKNLVPSYEQVIKDVQLCLGETGTGTCVHQRTAYAVFIIALLYLFY